MRGRRRGRPQLASGDQAEAQSSTPGRSVAQPPAPALPASAGKRPGSGRPGRGGAVPPPPRAPPGRPARHTRLPTVWLASCFMRLNCFFMAAAARGAPAGQDGTAWLLLHRLPAQAAAAVALLAGGPALSRHFQRRRPPTAGRKAPGPGATIGEAHAAPRRPHRPEAARQPGGFPRRVPDGRVLWRPCQGLAVRCDFMACCLWLD